MTSLTDSCVAPDILISASLWRTHAAIGQGGSRLVPKKESEIHGIDFSARKSIDGDARGESEEGENLLSTRLT